jgi:hypothetical protein
MLIKARQVKFYEKTRRLSKKYTPALACRSLDILHVVSALVMGAKEFASFDLRQRKLAETVGFLLLPLSFEK